MIIQIHQITIKCRSSLLSMFYDRRVLKAVLLFIGSTVEEIPANHLQLTPYLHLRIIESNLCN